MSESGGKRSLRLAMARTTVTAMDVNKAALACIAALLFPAAIVAAAPGPACPPPPANWGRAKDGIGHLRPVLSIVIRRDGTVLYGGRPVSDRKFTRYMIEAGSMNPQPQVVLDVTNRPNCKRLQQVRTIMVPTPICHHLCSEGANWRTWRISGGP
jgi:hypothetical protein